MINANIFAGTARTYLLSRRTRTSNNVYTRLHTHCRDTRHCTGTRTRFQVARSLLATRESRTRCIRARNVPERSRRRRLYVVLCAETYVEIRRWPDRVFLWTVESSVSTLRRQRVENTAGVVRRWQNVYRVKSVENRNTHLLCFD